MLRQRIEQLETQVTGLQAQVTSINEQMALTQEQLEGYQKLNEQGFAPKTLADTTLDPRHRTLLRVNIDSNLEADNAFVDLQSVAVSVEHIKELAGRILDLTRARG